MYVLSFFGKSKLRFFFVWEHLSRQQGKRQQAAQTKTQELLPLKEQPRAVPCVQCHQAPHAGAQNKVKARRSSRSFAARENV